MMEKRKSALSAISLAVITSFVTLVISSFAWFKSTGGPETPQNIGNVTGGATMNYFNGGNGTKETPYEIHTKTQLFYFAWLQYLGHFNEENDGSVDQMYFVLTNDINMEGTVLPPIGTQTYPFLGQLDGQGHTISNVVVSNKLSDLTAPPNEAIKNAELTDLCEIIGFFGVVGNIGTEGSWHGLTYDQNENNIKDFYLCGIEIENSRSSTLAGLAIGYQNAAATGIGIYTNEGEDLSASIDIGSATDVPHLVSSYTSNFSDNVFTGYTSSSYRDYSSDVFSSYQGYEQYNESGRVPEDGGGGEGPGGDGGWGGSIDMYTLNKRLTYISNAVDIESSTTYYRNTSTPNGYNFYFSQNLSKTNNLTVVNDPNSEIQGFLGLKKNTYLPINIDTDVMFDTEIKNGDDYKTSTMTRERITTNAYNTASRKNQGGTGEKVGSNNTGYFVGSNSTSDKIVSRSVAQSNLQTSFNNATSFNRTTHYLDLLAYDYNSNNFTVVNDEFNQTVNNSVLKSTYGSKTADTLGLVKYSGVRNSINTLLDESNNVHGIHFYTDTKDTSSTFSGSNIKIGSKSYSSYGLLRSSLNFTVEQPGVITAVQGSYYTSVSGYTTVNDSGFNLFKIDRDANNQITAVTEITKVRKNASTGAISYNNSTSDPIVYDSSKYESLAAKKALYYIEIPVGAGDFAIGELGSSYGAYFMYLDIGANGAEGEGGSGDEDPSLGKYNKYVFNEKVKSYEGITGIDFVKTKYSDIESLNDDVNEISCELSIKNPGKTAFISSYNSSTSKQNIAVTGSVSSKYVSESTAVFVNGSSTSLESDLNSTLWTDFAERRRTWSFLIVNKGVAYQEYYQLKVKRYEDDEAVLIWSSTNGVSVMPNDDTYYMSYNELYLYFKNQGPYDYLKSLSAQNSQDFEYFPTPAPII